MPIKFYLNFLNEIPKSHLYFTWEKGNDHFIFEIMKKIVQEIDNQAEDDDQQCTFDKDKMGLILVNCHIKYLTYPI